MAAATSLTQSPLPLGVPVLAGLSANDCVCVLTAAGAGGEYAGETKKTILRMSSFSGKFEFELALLH